MMATEESAGCPTHYAPPERVTDVELLAEVKAISSNQLIDGLMNMANGLFAVLNEHRQILALNESFLKLMGIENVIGCNRAPAR